MDGTLGFHPYFDIRHNLDCRIVSCTCQPHIRPRKIPRATECGEKKKGTSKFAKTLFRIEARTSQLLAHYLDQGRHHSLRIYVGYSESKYHLRISLTHPRDCHFAHVQ